MLMAKAGSTFFLRAELDMLAAGTYNEEPIPLGAFLNPLADQALVIHNVSVQIADATQPEAGPFSEDAVMNIGWNLTTSSQNDFNTVFLADNSVVASGRYTVMSSQTGTNTYFEFDRRDVMPQDYTAGYTVAAESMFLGAHSDVTATGGDYKISIVMECSQIKLGKN
ncbi:unnamed protein product, partial [marine sediment metagenome]